MMFHEHLILMHASGMLPHKTTLRRGVDVVRVVDRGSWMRVPAGIIFRYRSSYGV